MNPRLFVSILFFWSCLALAASAQLAVKLTFPRNTYLLHESALATLSITNQAGRDITLEDSPTEGAWCQFQMKAVQGDFVPLKDAFKKLPPLFIPAGETVSRSIDIAAIHQIPSIGRYKIRAYVNFAPAHSQIWSAPVYITVDTGRVTWSTTAGVPEDRVNPGAFRTFSLVTHQREEGIFLYAKLEGKDEGIVYPLYFLGRMLSAMPPQPQLDRNNNLYVLHASSDATYVLSQVDIATGEFGQAMYRSATPRGGRPSLAKQPDGKLTISGGVRVKDSELLPKDAPERARISDRPAGF